MKNRQTLNPVSPSSSRNRNFFVVAIGLSAGGLEALELFFDHFPADSGMALVIVQHLDPRHKSQLAELLKGHTKIPVQEIIADSLIQKNCVFVIPPGKGLQIRENRFLLSDLTETNFKSKTIDTFFSSLAEDKNEDAIGIVLSGANNDGLLGCAKIKESGGMIIAQDPDTALFNTMPISVINADLADFVLTPENMGALLIDYHKNGTKRNLVMKSSEMVVNNSSLEKIFGIIFGQTGYDFSTYKENMILRRIEKMMFLKNIVRVDHFLSFLKENHNEVVKLYHGFLIGVTAFFRDKEVFDSLERNVVPQLLKKSSEGSVLRIWICGCSTGQEAYSLAMIFREAIEQNKQNIKITIFATDLDEDAIKLARLGVFDERALEGVSQERISRFFIKRNDKFEVVKELRAMIVFACHNLLKDPPFSKLDFISCRNFLIYLKPAFQKKLITVFHLNLKNDGILLLGKSETKGDKCDFFSAIDLKNKIYKKQNGNHTGKIVLETKPFLTSVSTSNEFQEITVPVTLKNIEIIDRPLLLPEVFEQASALIDTHNQTLYLAGKTDLFLNLPVGEIDWNILKLVKNDLKSDLLKSIKKARRIKANVFQKGVELRENQQKLKVNITVRPLHTKKYDSGTLMIIFDLPRMGDFEGQQTLTDDQDEISKKSNINDELKLTRQNLREARVDLKFSNEQLLSANEEMQSTNEELETSREELQSVNEELTTVNADLNDKINQLSQANDDLNNLLRGIEVATVFLDGDLKVKRFTPAAGKIFNLISSDIDRPITQLTSNLNYNKLSEDVNSVFETLVPKEVEVSSTTGVWYDMRIIPYRTSESTIEGVLLTLVDINRQKTAENVLIKITQQLNLVMSNLEVIPYTGSFAPEFGFDFIGASCERVTGFKPEYFLGNSNFWKQQIHPDDLTGSIEAFTNIPNNLIFQFEFRFKCTDGNYKRFTNYVRYVGSTKSEKKYITGLWQYLANPV